MIVAAYVAMCLIWSSTWSIIKIGLQDAGPFTSVAVRFVLAASVLLLITAARKRRLPQTTAFWKLTVFIGLTHMALPYSLVYLGEQRISSTLAAILYAMLPVFVAISARVGLGDPLTVRKVVGIFVGMGGVVVIFTDSLRVAVDSAAPIGVAMLLGSIIFTAVSSVVVKRYLVNYDPLDSLAGAFSVAAIAQVIVAAIVEGENPMGYSPVTWGTILYLGLVGSVLAFGLYFWVIKLIDVTLVAYQTFIIPVLAMGWGWLLLRETLSLYVLAGGVLILLGIAIATAPRRRTEVQST